MPDIRSEWRWCNVTEVTQHTFPKSVDLSTVETVTLLRNSKANTKKTKSMDYGSPGHTATAEKMSNKRLFSRSQSYRESNTPSSNATTNRSPTDHTDSPYNSQRHAFRAKRSTVLYISKDSQPVRKPVARHFTSGISSTDYTERRKPSLLYGHWYRHTSRTNPEVQYAFKISMTHWILQFALRIAVRSVLHRCASLDIHCWKLLSS